MLPSFFIFLFIYLFTHLFKVDNDKKNTVYKNTNKIAWGLINVNYPSLQEKI